MKLKKRIKAALPIIEKPKGMNFDVFLKELKEVKIKLDYCDIMHEATECSDIAIAIMSSVEYLENIDEFLKEVIDIEINDNVYSKINMWWIKKNIKFYKNLV